MFVKVRGPDGKRIEIITIDLSMKVKEFKEKVANIFHVEPENQRLTHKGKQLANKYKLFDYDLQVNDVLQLTVKKSEIQKQVVKDAQVPSSIEKRLKNLPQIQESYHFKVGEYVDFLDPQFGAWFQGKIVIIYVEDQERFDAYSKEVDPPTQRNGERTDYCGKKEVDPPTRRNGERTDYYGSEFVAVYTKETSATSTLNRDSPVVISDDETLDVVTVRSSSPESVIFIPPDEPEEPPVIFIPPDDEPNICLPPCEPVIYDLPNTTVSSDVCDIRIVSTVGSAPVSDTNKQAAPPEITCDEISDKGNAASDADHSESGDSGHSSHMSLKNTSQSSGLPGCEALNQEVLPDDGCLYEIINLNHVDQIEMICKLSQVRPMSRKHLSFSEIECGQTVLVNYNAEGPDKVGHWFDFRVLRIVNGTKKKLLEGEIRVLSWHPYQLTDVEITKLDDIWKIEKLTLLRDREEFCSPENVQKRPVRALCENCNDNLAANCTACSCRVCGMKTEPSKQIVCDGCDSYYHVWCLTPPLEEVPDVDKWFCGSCELDPNRNVKASKKPRVSKKKDCTPRKKKESAPAIKKERKSADPDLPTKLQNGMANARRSKICTVVPPNHFGPIPGVEVGTTWRFRMQASEAGVHRPPVGGMHGREGVGAFSIVLSGGYEDDVDFGDSFWYTGSGGRDLTGNKRTSSKHSCDQLFTHTNKALALNCNAPLSDEGAKAEDWRAGKPVRVLRSYKFRKRSPYAPEEGLRYDGIYKVVEYRPVRGRHGFIVWMYFLRRDDPAPAPWTEEGKMLMDILGLRMQLPENYEEPVKRKPEHSSESPAKRLAIEDNLELDLSIEVKPEPYEIDPVIEDIIARDEQNMRLWEDCCLYLRDGMQKFLEAVKENFTCICCHELVYLPVTTPCNHNFCLECLQTFFRANVYHCPTCRADLTENFQYVVNEYLFAALNAFFPRYD